MRRAFHWMVPTVMVAAMTIAGACARAPDDAVRRSRFEVGQPIQGRVVENVPACEVDAPCYLSIEFADTAVVALYGLGDRDPPPCEIEREVSNVAFGLRVGDPIRVVLSPCGTEGYFLSRVEHGSAPDA